VLADIDSIDFQHPWYLSYIMNVENVTAGLIVTVELPKRWILTFADVVYNPKSPSIF